MSMKMVKLQERMAWILRVLTKPVEVQELNHYQRTQLEEELTELEMKYDEEKESSKCQC